MAELDINTLFTAYETNPDQFTAEQKMRIVALARKAGRTDIVEPTSSLASKVGNAVYGAADSILMGLLPEQGMEQINSGDRTARQIGSFVGALAPWAFVGKLGIASKLVGATSARFAATAAKAEGMAATKSAGLLGKVLGKNGGTASKFLANKEFATKVTEGAIAGAWSNVFEDPGAALTGAVIGGGAMGFANRGLLSKAVASPGAESVITSSTGQPPVRGFLRKLSAIDKQRIITEQKLVERGYSPEFLRRLSNEQVSGIAESLNISTVKYGDIGPITKAGVPITPTLTTSAQTGSTKIKRIFPGLEIEDM